MSPLPNRHSRESGNPSPTVAARAIGTRWIPAFAGMTKRVGIALPLLLAACARQVPSAVDHAAATPGFLLGVWHGFIFPVAWVLSLFLPDVAIYAVPNTGGWYDFGYFVGIVFLGVGARSTRTVYVTRRARR